MQGSWFRYQSISELGDGKGNPFLEASFDVYLLEEGDLPTAALEAPLGSWILARLQAEAGDEGLDLEAEQRGSGGGPAIALLAFDGDREVARFEILLRPFAVDLQGVAAEGFSKTVRDDLARLLLERPDHLETCRLEYFDPAWPESSEELAPTQPDADSRDLYGWDGRSFLGQENHWSEHRAGAPWPGSDFPGHYESALRHEAKTLEMATLVLPKPPVAEAEDGDNTAQVVAETRDDFQEALESTGVESVAYRLYDLDGDLEESEQLETDEAVAKLTARVEDGYDAAWRLDDSRLVLKVWEYPADEPPWDRVLADSGDDLV